MKRQKQSDTDYFIKLMDEQTRIGLNNLGNYIQEQAEKQAKLYQEQI